MGGGQGDPQLRRGQHHHHIGVSLVGQQFSGTDIGDAARIDIGLLYRAGNHALQIATEAVLPGSEQGVDGCPGIARVGAAHHHRLRQRQWDDS